MLVKFKQCIFQKLHPLMNSDLSKKTIFMTFQWSKAQFFLSRLWITIYFLKGLCMNSMIKLVKHKWKSLQTRTLVGSHDSWSHGLCPSLVIFFNFFFNFYLEFHIEIYFNIMHGKLWYHLANTWINSWNVTAADQFILLLLIHISRI